MIDTIQKPNRSVARHEDLANDLLMREFVRNLAEKMGQDSRSSLHRVQAQPKVEAEKKTERTFLEKLFLDSNHRNIFLSVINAVLHGAATVTSYENQGKEATKASSMVDKTAFAFTKWIVPIISNGSAAVHSLMNKNIIETVIKLIPPLLLPIVGDANIDTVYGATNCFNQFYDMAKQRIKTKSEESPEFYSAHQQSTRSFAGGARIIFQELKHLFADFKNGTLNSRDRFYFYNVPLILAGSLPILLFARHDRDSWFARITGALRNIGGVMGDYAFIVNEKDNHKKAVGVFWAVAAACDFAKRWVGEGTSKVLIHLSAALNVAGLSMWNAFNGKKLDESKQNRQEGGLVYSG